MKKLMMLSMFFCCFFVIKTSSAQSFILRVDTTVGTSIKLPAGTGTIRHLIGAYVGSYQRSDTGGVGAIVVGFNYANNGSFGSSAVTNVTVEADGVQQGPTLITVRDEYNPFGNLNIPLVYGPIIRIKVYGDVDVSSLQSGSSITTNMFVYGFTSNNGGFQTIPTQGQVTYAVTRGTIGPEVVTGFITHVTDSSFTVHGSFDSFGKLTSVWPEIGTANQYQLLAQPAIVVNSMSLDTFSVTINHLDPSQGVK